jgi:hypothetical protein
MQFNSRNAVLVEPTEQAHHDLFGQSLASVAFLGGYPLNVSGGELQFAWAGQPDMNRSSRRCHEPALVSRIVYHESHHVRTEPRSKGPFPNLWPPRLVEAESHGLEHHPREADNLTRIGDLGWSRLHTTIVPQTASECCRRRVNPEVRRSESLGVLPSPKPLQDPS